MYLKDIMRTNVVTIPSSTNLADAKRIMQVHRVRRIPVVDRGELVGIVSIHHLEMATPRKGATLSVWEFSYQLHAIKVGEIMQKTVVTVSPDLTVEEAVAIAQSTKVGSLIVLDTSRNVVGIVTTNDLFYKIVNPVLGVGESGTRIEVKGGGEGKTLGALIALINEANLEIANLHIIPLPGAKKKDVVFHLKSEDVGQLLKTLKAKHYKASIRNR